MSRDEERTRGGNSFYESGGEKREKTSGQVASLQIEVRQICPLKKLQPRAGFEGGIRRGLGNEKRENERGQWGEDPIEARLRKDLLKWYGEGGQVFHRQDLFSLYGKKWKVGLFWNVRRAALVLK